MTWKGVSLSCRHHRPIQLEKAVCDLSRHVTFFFSYTQQPKHTAAETVLVHEEGKRIKRVLFADSRLWNVRGRMGGRRIVTMALFTSRIDWNELYHLDCNALPAVSGRPNSNRGTPSRVVQCKLLLGSRVENCLAKAKCVAMSSPYESPSIYNSQGHTTELALYLVLEVNMIIACSARFSLRISKNVREKGRHVNFLSGSVCVKHATPSGRREESASD